MFSRIFSVVALLAMMASAAAQDKPKAITADRILDAYEQAVRNSLGPAIAAYRLEYEVYPPLGNREPMYEVARYQKANGIFVENARSLTNTYTQGFDGQDYWYFGRPLTAAFVEYNKTSGTMGFTGTPSISVGIDFPPITPDWRTIFTDTKLLGRTTVKNQMAVVVRCTLKTGYSINYYFDATTHLLLRADYSMVMTDLKGTSQIWEVTRYYEKYKDYAGWKVPTVIREDGPGMSRDMVLRKFEINPKIDDKIFVRTK